MKLLEKVSHGLAIPVLTKGRIGFALSVAVVTDALQTSQVVLGPLSWLLDEVLDVIAMILITLALGFHPLLLPTFIIEAFPVADMLPTWTGCTAAVVMLRRKSQAQTPRPPKLVSTAPAPPILELPAPPTATPQAESKSK